MLNVQFGDMPEAIYNTAVYFKNTYRDDWITDDFGKEVIRDVDKSEVVSAHVIESPVLGSITPLMLSGGVRIDGVDIDRPHRVIVVANNEFQRTANVITVEENGGTETDIIKYETASAAGDTENIPRYISPSAIDTSYSSSSQTYTFTVSLKDKSPVEARRKLRVLVLAFGLEVRNCFPGVTIEIRELVDSEEDIPIKEDMPASRIMIIALLAGLLLAAGAVYIAYLADNTVSDRDTLEKITGVKLLARLEDQEAIA